MQKRQSAADTPTSQAHNKGLPIKRQDLRPSPASRDAHMMAGVPTQQNAPLSANQHAFLQSSAPADVAKPGRWTKSEDERLKEAVDQIGASNWKRISQEYFSNTRSDMQCLHRWKKVLHPGLVKGPWTKEEDQIIINCIQEGITKWSEIASRVTGRVGKQCRERWLNQLDPTIKKGDWSLEEDRIMIATQEILGNKWSKIAKLLPGRTENSVKNRWYAMHKTWSAQKEAGQSLVAPGTAEGIVRAAQEEAAKNEVAKPPARPTPAPKVKTFVSSSAKTTAQSTANSGGLDRTVEDDTQPQAPVLPDGWRRLPSRSRPHECSYYQECTGYMC
jgi:hypothetical protein